MTQRIATMVLEHWDDIDGYAASRNMPALADLPLARFVSFGYWWATRNAEQKDVEKFRNQLWRPPKEDTRPIPKESPWSPENETKAFAAFKAQTTGSTNVTKA